MEQPNILILGGSGMMGHQFYKVSGQHFPTYATFRRFSNKLEPYFQRDTIVEGVVAENFDSVIQAFTKVRPQVVVNCIGVVKQQGASKDPIACLNINSLFPHRLAKLCQSSGARLIHLSTDCVFSGQRGNYCEDDYPDAMDLYGRSKLLGEVFEPGCLTLRTSIIGRELNSCQGLIEWFLSNEGKTVSGYQKAIYTGLTTNALSELIIDVIRKFPELHGVWQVASQPISKFDLLTLVRDIYQANIRINPDDQFYCDRSLTCEKFHQATGWVAPSWPDMIRAMHNASKRKNVA